MDKTLVRLLRAKVFNGIRPKNITHQSMSGRFAESIKLSIVTVRPFVLDAIYFRRTFRISSMVFNSGDRPPCMQRNCLFIIAAKGRAQKDSIHAS